jgi:hypothetical protein
VRFIAKSYRKVGDAIPVFRGNAYRGGIYIAFGYGLDAEEVLARFVRRPDTQARLETRRRSPASLGLLKHGGRINDKKHAEIPGKISSRIERFDDIDCGGLPLDRMTPLMGEPGSRKIILTLQTLIGAITRHGRSGVLYSAAI